MTVEALRILLELYQTGDADWGSDNISQSAISCLQEAELMFYDGKKHTITKKGTAHAIGVVKLPLPTQIWYSPAEDI